MYNKFVENNNISEADIFYLYTLKKLADRVRFVKFKHLMMLEEVKKLNKNLPYANSQQNT